MKLLRNGLFLLALCIFFAAPTTTNALSYRTTEGATVDQISSIVSAYAAGHYGKNPASWAELQSLMDRPIDDLYRSVKPTQRYAFLSRPLRLPPPEDGELLIIARRPFRDGELHQNWYGGISTGLREPGRYIIYRTGTGAFQAAYKEEAWVQHAFHGSEFLLPVPDNEPLRQHEAGAYWHAVFKWCLVALVAALIAAGFRVRCGRDISKDEPS